jgi:hypothetical protein
MQTLKMHRGGFGRFAVVVLAVLTMSAIGASAAIAEGSSAEYGQCRELTANTTPKVRHGRYTEGKCRILSQKKGKATTKGDFEWYPGAPASCVAQKHGEYSSASCGTKSAKAHKGKFERQACYPNCAKYTSSSGPVVLEVAGVATIDCEESTGSGAITGAKAGETTEGFTGCGTTASSSGSGIRASDASECSSLDGLDPLVQRPLA